MVGGFHLINIQIFNVATDAITANPYINTKVYFNEFVTNFLRGNKIKKILPQKNEVVF